MKIEKTPFYSWKTGELANGCKLCVKGAKLVLFVTGLCPRKCWYCPLADTKKNKDVVYANEWKISKDEDIIKEAELCEAEGAGITGGDPFLVLDRTVKYIQMLKQKFGKNFHIHLYAPTDLITEESLKKLYDSGLDEIRLHPCITDKKDWNKIELVRKFGWDIGVEIPVIPNLEKETRELIDYFKDKIGFLNLNELEISDTNANQIVKLGFTPKDEFSYGVEGSEKLALKLLEKYSDMNIHYCTTTLKDKVQMANRIKKRAKNAANDFDKVDEEGMLTRGALYLEELKPSFGYRKKLESADRKLIIKKLKEAKKKLRFRLKLDEVKLRLICSQGDAENHADEIKKHGLIPAVVEEYPTWDAVELDVEFL